SSDPISLDKIVSTRPVVTQQPNWPHIFSGESVTLQCEIHGGRNTQWEYEWTTSSSSTPLNQAVHRISRASSSNSGGYRCRGRKTLEYSSTAWSNYFQLTVSSRAVVSLQPNWPHIYRGESITLICEIQDGGDTEWEYKWEKNSMNHTAQKEFNIIEAYTSQTGEYRCKGRHRSGQRSSTEWSDPVSLTVSDKPEPKLTVSPSWLSPGASVTLNCGVEYPSAGWRFYWYKLLPDREAGTCGNTIKVTVQVTGKAVVSLQPNWPHIYKGESITLICEIQDGGDTEWEYEWEKNSRPHRTQKEFNIIGTYTSQTGEYRCKGRHRSGQRSSTEWSDPVSLTVSCKSNVSIKKILITRTQHFRRKYVTLTCAGNSSHWKMKRFFEEKVEQPWCSSSWMSMHESTCSIFTSHTSAVYWCEFDSGEFSNAVNITSHDKNVVLESPVYPVTEGDSVTFRCINRNKKLISIADFYQNGKLIKNKTKGEMTLHAVSKSDEGFYMCKGSGSQSACSWMAVNPSNLEKPSIPNTSHRVLWLVRLVIGLVLVIVLLLLCYYRKIKGESFPCSYCMYHTLIIQNN
uniref:Ig-like domain-containing protein n=1 Tax=Myripristis murdjan TaxID=586833 RepID=A0A667WVG4_9TELE